MSKWTPARIVCMILISPLIAFCAIVVLPLFLLFGFVDGLNWVASKAFGWEYRTIFDSDF